MAGARSDISLIQTPSYELAILFFIFLVIAFILEQTFHHLHHYFHKHKKDGMVAALDNFKTELMTLGFISLLLVAFGMLIEQHCVTRNTTWWLSEQTSAAYVDGHATCPQCMKDTTGLEKCYLYGSTCYPEYKPVKSTIVADKNSSSSNPPPAADSGGHRRRLLGGGGGGGGKYTNITLDDDYAKYYTSYYGTGTEACKYAKATPCTTPGEVPMLSFHTLEQVHILLFLIAMLHITCTVLLMPMAYLRIVQWRRWEASENVHRDAAGEALDNYEKEKLGAKSGEPEQHGISGLKSRMKRAATRVVGRVTHKDDGLHGAGSAALDPVNEGVPLGPTSSSYLQVDKAGTIDEANVLYGAEEPAPPADVEAGGASGPALPTKVEVSGATAAKLARMHTRLDKPHHFLAEIALCFLQQFRVIKPVTELEFKMMSASFILTHRVNAKTFNFVQYIERSMEDDFSKLVGLSIAEWLFLVLIFLLAGVTGWMASWFNILAWILCLILNTKLIHITRYVTRGGAVNKLDKSVFWFRKPQWLLPIIRAVIFSPSYLLASQVFFAWQFGANSCYFNNKGFRAYAAWPFWVDTILATLLILMLGLVTLPVYALAVQMGSTYKHFMIPASVKELMQGWGKRAKHRVKEAKEEEGMMGGAVKGLQRVTQNVVGSVTAPAMAWTSGGKPADAAANADGGAADGAATATAPATNGAAPEV